MTYATDTRPIGNPFRAMGEKLTEHVRHRLRRRAFNRLLSLDDHLLDDMGVSRAEVIMASYLPLSVNAAEELRRMSVERRRKLM